MNLLPMTARPGRFLCKRLIAMTLWLAASASFVPQLALAQDGPTDDNRARWALQFGIGVISDANLTDYASGRFNAAKGDSGGLTYNFTAAYRVGELDWRVGRFRLRPELEIPMTLTLVDENSTSLFADYNVAAVLRWHNWPWDRYLDTSIGIGAGLSYSSNIWRIDEERHPGEDRANLKFTLPVDITVALPGDPRHQLSFFIDHQSGGHITDNGGVDALGIAYRLSF